MKAKAKTSTRLTSELLEMARDMRAIGMMDKPAHDKITKRLKAKNEPVLMPFFR